MTGNWEKLRESVVENPNKRKAGTRSVKRRSAWWVRTGRRELRGAPWRILMAVGAADVLIHLGKIMSELLTC